MHYSQNQIKGIIWFLLHCLAFSIISTIYKHLLQDLSVFQILFFQTSIASVYMTPFILFYYKKELDFSLTGIKLHSIRAFFWLFSSCLYFYAITKMQMPRAVALSFGVPLFTTILAIIFLKEELHIYRILGLISGFSGMLVIIKPGFESFEPVAILVVIAAFSWSITDIIIKVVGRTQSAAVTTYYFTIFCAALVTPIAIYFWQPLAENNFIFLVALAALHCFNMITVSLAYQKADLTIMMPYTFSQLIFIAVFAYIFFGEVITISTAIGSVIIVTSASFITYREKVRHKKFLATELGAKMEENI